RRLLRFSGPSGRTPGADPARPHRRFGANRSSIRYVVDYYGVFEHLSDALAGYEAADVDDTMLGMSVEVGALEPAAEKVRLYLQEHAGVISPPRCPVRSASLSTVSSR
ncbi:hypothetical protein ACE14D_22715, partial [Streptomyces sp. Act-28]